MEGMKSVFGVERDGRHEVSVRCGKGWGGFLFVEIGWCGTTTHELQL